MPEVLKETQLENTVQIREKNVDEKHTVKDFKELCSA